MSAALGRPARGMASYPTKGAGIQSADDGHPVLPGDSFTKPTRAIYVGTGGDLVVTMASGRVVTLVNASDGMLYPIAVIAIDAATTAGDLVALR